MTRLTALDPYRKPVLPGGAFAMLPYAPKQRAQQLLWKFCQRWGTELSPWRGVCGGQCMCSSSNSML